MTYDPDQVYDLLPRVYWRRDAEVGEPLRALLTLVAEQADIIEADIDALYDDWFIETCQPWVVPYIGDLVGASPLGGFDEELQRDSAEAERLLARVSPRRDIADTVANRRRKGTLAILERLTADVADWPARAVEFRTLLAVSQAVGLYSDDEVVDRRRRHRGRSVDLHDGDGLDLIDGPFDRLAHTVEVSRINSHRRQRRFNIPEVGIHVWRLRPYGVTHAPAYCDDRDRSHFTFSILGNDTPLVTLPVAEPTATHIADETNVPGFIRRRAFREALAQYYGPERSLCIWLEDRPMPLSRIVPADLTRWHYRPQGSEIAVDPVLGRIALPARSAPDSGVWVSYHYAFSSDLGGGEYQRPIDSPATVFRVGPGEPDETVMGAVRRWQAAKLKDPGARSAVIEIVDSGEYVEQVMIELEADDDLTVRAAQATRPVIRLLDFHSNRPDALVVKGTADAGDDATARLVLDGLMIAGRSIRVEGAICTMAVRHCTLVPGWSIDEHCCAEHEEEPSIELFETSACLEIASSIVGTVLVNETEVATKRRRDGTAWGPNPVYVSDSIVDATRDDLDAVTGPGGRHAFAVLSMRRTTVRGAVRAHRVERIDDSILHGEVSIAVRQTGCLRFSWVQPGSRTPRRFHCEPDLSGDPARVVPLFTNDLYGTPGYAQLALDCADEIRRGAEDGSEMGAFHDLFQPQREDNLRLRLYEYTPSGSDAGIIFAT